jgi:hypothetical protein
MWLISSALAASEQNNVAARPPINNAFDYFVYHTVSNTALIIALTIIAVGVFVIRFQFKLLKEIRTTPSDILRITSVTLIISFSMALAAFLDDLKEAAPIFGLFSTIAGYLLGSVQGGRTQTRDIDDLPSAHQKKEETSSRHRSSVAKNAVRTEPQ